MLPRTEIADDAVTFDAQEALGAVTIEYYQYPSWWPTQPSPLPGSSLILSEQLTKPVTLAPVTYGAPLHLKATTLGQWIAAAEKSGSYYYPTLSDGNFVKLEIIGGSGAVRHGDGVQIKTMESVVGTNNVLGAWSNSSWLYYYAAGSDNNKQGWTIQKRDPTDPIVHFGDDVCFVNRSWTNQAMQSDLYSSTYYLKIASGDYYWSASVAL